jgi:hypothetical protein
MKQKPYFRGGTTMRYGYLIDGRIEVEEYFDYALEVFTIQKGLRQRIIEELSKEVKGKIFVNFVGDDTMKVTVMTGDIDISWELSGIWKMIAANYNWSRFVNYIVKDLRRVIERRYFKCGHEVTYDPKLSDPDFWEFVRNNP